DGIFYEFPSDNCDYYTSVGGAMLGNWATEWQSSHTQNVDWYTCTSAHSEPLNANRKAYAAWWLWARLAGWNPDGGPVANFSGTPTSGTAPLEVSFTDSSAGGVEIWSWSFGDGGSSTNQNPTYTYNEFDTYTVSLEVTGPGGSDTEIRNDYITVTAMPAEYDLTVEITGEGSVTLDPSGTTYDQGTQVQLTALPDGSEGVFTGWSGDLSDLDNPAIVTMDADKTVTATFIETGAGSGDLTSKSCVDPDSIEDSPDKPDDFPYGLLEMEMEVVNAGDQAILTIYLPNAAPVDYKWYKYTSAGEWIDFDRNVISSGAGDGAEFNINRTEVSVYITDNGPYDDDPTDMVIRDPSGLGFLTSNNGSSSSGGGCFISTVGK
ncbi:MAG: PKD domain-containing protein, partial [Deltaproteobacteria bacterium]|nr:PKD domain-containing protein [Deltaproteobacteria bacterium]